MNQPIDWKTCGEAIDGSLLTHCAICSDHQNSVVQSFINSAIDRAIAIIPQSMHEDARYLLFNWSADTGTLTAVTTDDEKSHDASESIQLSIKDWQPSPGTLPADQSETLHYWIRDYLTTCADFLHYSLIAVYCEGDRNKSRLL